MFVLCDDTSTALGNHLVLNHLSNAGTKPLTSLSSFCISHAIIFLSKIDSSFCKIIHNYDPPQSRTPLPFYCQESGSVWVNGFSFHSNCLEFQIIWPFKYALPFHSYMMVQQVFERFNWQVGTICLSLHGHFYWNTLLNDNEHMTPNVFFLIYTKW